MSTFRLLHLSDLHAGATPRVLGFPDWRYAGQFPLGPLYPFSCSSFDEEMAEAVTRFAYLEKDRFDLILITGDLATTGNAADLLVAAELVNAPPSLAPRPGQTAWAPWLSDSGSPTLRASGRDVVLLPGNHDRFQGFRKSAGGRQFDRRFGSLPTPQSPYWKGGPVETLQVLAAGGERLAIVAADFSLAANADADKASGGFFAYLGQGRAYPARLAELERETVTQRATGAAVVWAVHFPPGFPGIRPDLCLLDDALLLAAARRAEVDHVFCGHTHVPKQYRLPGPPPVTVYCAGSAMQYCVPPPYTNSVHLAQVDVTNGSVAAVRWTTHYWSPRRKRFV